MKNIISDEEGKHFEDDERKFYYFVEKEEKKSTLTKIKAKTSTFLIENL